MTRVLKVKEYPFYWKTDTSILGFSGEELVPVTFKAEKIDGNEKEVFDISPKEFFTVSSALYFSVDFRESVINGEEEIITVTRHFEQPKGGEPKEIVALPTKPLPDFFIGSDGRYDIAKNRYQEIFVSDIYQLSSGRFNRCLKISNYHYSSGQIVSGSFIDVQEGLPGVREAGLYFWPDQSTAINRVSVTQGRMWKL